MLIAELELPKLFDSIRCNITRAPSPYASEQVYSHFCENCGQVFIARYDYRNYGLATTYDGTVYYCPSCRQKAVDRAAYSRYESSVAIAHGPGEIVPRSVRLYLREFKEMVDVDVFAEAIAFEKDAPEYVRSFLVRERIRFDIKAQKTWFRQTCGCADMTAEPTEVTNPYDGTLLQVSMLGWIRKNSRAWKKQKSEIAAFLRTLRDTVARKLLEVKGYRMKALSVPGDADYGLLLNPIRNISWRLAAPDGPNLNELFRRQVLNESGFCMTRNTLMPEVKSADFENILTHLREGKSFPQAVLAAFGIPDTKAGRKLIAGGKIYVVAIARILSRIQALDIDRKKQYFRELVSRYEKWLNKNPMRYWSSPELFPNDSGIDFFLEAAEKTGTAKAFRLLSQTPVKELNDTGAMYKGLPEKIRDRVWVTHKKKSLHDICMELSWQQKHPDYPLNVPKPIVNRLMMQKDHLRFFLPETYHQLHDAGTELNNCVGGPYPEQMKNGECCIVLVADDIGKLKVCIEIRKDTIKQAKLFGNAPLWKDKRLLQAVRDWADAVGLKCGTDDLVSPGEMEAARLRLLLQAM